MRHPVIQLPCPHCGSGCVHGHGSFGLMDGARQQRYLCRAYGRTFNQDTGTPLSYLKKRDRWEQLAEGMAQGLSIRSLAAALNIAVATAFRWRHRLLGALCRRPQPVLTGQAAASEAYVPYSEKGSRQTDGRGAYGVRRVRAAGAGFGRRRFRRFINGKPSCVLLACAGEQRVVAIVSSGQPAPEQLQSTLAQTLGAGAELSTLGLAPYAAACLRLGVAVSWGRHPVPSPLPGLVSPSWPDRPATAGRKQHPAAAAGGVRDRWVAGAGQGVLQFHSSLEQSLGGAKALLPHRRLSSPARRRSPADAGRNPVKSTARACSTRSVLIKLRKTARPAERLPFGLVAQVSMENARVVVRVQRMPSQSRPWPPM